MKFGTIFLLSTALMAQTPPPGQLRAAANKSLALLQKATVGFYKVQDCHSCHNTTVTVQAFAMARERGLSVNAEVVKGALVKPLTRGHNITSIDWIFQDNLIIDPAASDTAILIAAHAGGLAPSLTTAIDARLIANHQRADGHWATLDSRPPEGVSLFSTTALAVRAMQYYMPVELRQETAARTERARAWLLQAKPVDTEDSTFRVFGLVWSGATKAQVGSAVAGLRQLQRPDGGWAQIPDRDADAYSTGEALVALNEAGVSVTDPAWQKGLRWLLSTQNPDGSWHVATRQVSPAQVSPPYFESGFPFGHDQFISTAATAYAAMALMLPLPKAAWPERPLSLAELAPKGEQPWMRTALFGSAAELRFLLDKGLDVNSQTEGGTSLLMMAAPDAAKVKLLLDRGANVNAKAKSGYTALFIAALYRGTTESVRLLLDKGAAAAPGTGVMFNASPLALSVFAGEPANISQLLAKGADPHRKMLLMGATPLSPLFLAVGFGELDVMRALMAGGANPKEVEMGGMTMLHSAAIGNRVEAARLLLDSGVPVNAVDANGYSPLLYAATLNFGDTRLAQALLQAHADPALKSKEGATALSQTERFRYPLLQKVLKSVTVPH